MTKAFRLLASITAVSAYLQIALGGVVRNSGSGLGCRDQWPLCNGHPYPGWELHALIEYSHRTFGALTSVLMLITFVAALALHARRRPLLVWLAGGALAAVSLEIPLGALVVFRDLSGLLVMAHLAAAMLILGLLLATAVLAFERREGSRLGLGAWPPVATAVLAFLTLLTGGGVVAGEADQQCHSWPLCGGGLQFDFAGVNALTMLHRLTVAGLVVLAAYAAYAAWRRPDRTAAGWSVATLLLILVQAAIGAGAALSGESALFNSLHVAVGAAAWGAATIAALVVLRPAALSEGSLGLGRSRREVGASASIE